MSVLARKLRRDVWHAKVTMLAIAAIMTCGVLCFVMMRSLYFDLSTAQDDYYRECRMADFWADLKKAPLQVVERIASIPGVASASGRISFLATVDLPTSVKPLRAQVLSLEAHDGTRHNRILLRRGRSFSADGRAEAILNDAFATANQIEPGDSFSLLLNNRRQEFRVVGTALSSEFVYLLGPGSLVPDPQHFGVVYLQRGYVEEIFDMQGAANSIVGRLTPQAAADPDPVLKQIERVLGPFGGQRPIARKNQMSHLFLDSEIEGLGTFATIAPAIFLTVAALVLNILLSRLAESQRTTIGTLKALGYSRLALFRHYLAFGLVIGLLSGVAGCLLGYLSARGMCEIYQQFFEFPSLHTHFYPRIYLTGLLISSVCAVTGSANGAWRALRLAPAEAMRAKAPPVGGRIFLERLTRLWRTFSFGWKMALRNLIRNRARTSVGIFTAAVGASLLVIGFVSIEATQFLIDFQYRQINRADFDLTLQREAGWEVVQEIGQLPGVEHAEPQLHVSCTLHHRGRERRGGITGLPSRPSMTIPRDATGNRLSIPPAGLLVTSKLAELLDVEEGELVEIRPTTGRRLPFSAPVVAIADSYLGNNVYADIRYLSRQIGEELAINAVQVKSDGSSASQQAFYRRVKQLPALEGISSRQDTIKSLQQALLDSQQTSIAMLIGFAGIIFFGGMLNVSLVSLTERLRELATLRVLGYGKWRIGGLLLRESMVINTLGACAGLPLGWLLYLAMVESYEMDFVRLPIVAPPWVWWSTLLLAATFTIAAQGVVQWRIHRLDWLAGLQVKE
ncbi:MAG: ABC transporter permease [Planctomycetales bacterium]|nr:ABC transporter permease [Planctomycetales bacterium]